MLIQPQVLKGFRDFLPAQALQRLRLTRILEETFESFGFYPIDTPVLEYKKVLLGKGGGETDRQVYEFTDRGKREVAMRFDLTVPFARFMAAHYDELYLPFKRYHIDKVWRGENTQRGRYREFVQCDFDIVGIDNSSADFEILLLMHHSFLKLGITDITIHISHRGVFNHFLDKLGISEKSVEIMRSVDKIGKIGKQKVQELLLNVVSDEVTEKILEFIKPEESFLKTLDKMTNLSGGISSDTERLREIYSNIEYLGLEKYFLLDPSITRGLDYYTGIVFETFLTELPSIGSVCSGGRYNNLASLYTKQNLPGVGSSIGLDRLIAGLEELKLLSDNSGTTDCIILCMDSKNEKNYHALADRFRNNGVSCEIYFTKKKLSSQFSYAEKKRIPIAIFLGENEIQADKLTLKDLKARNNFEMISFDEAVQICKNLRKK